MEKSNVYGLISKDVTTSKNILGIINTKPLFATVESQAQNNETILLGRSPSCERNIHMQKSSKISGAESVLKEKVLKPFWNEYCAEIASSLWLPTETDWLDSEATYSNSCLSKMVENSWFSTRILYHQRKNSQKTYSISCTSSLAVCTDCEITKSKLVKLFPTKEQRKIFKYWTDVSRFVFNWAIDKLKLGEKPNWMHIKKKSTQELPEWTKKCPFQIKGIAVKEAVAAWFKARKTPKFRTRKDMTQSCYIPKSAIKTGGIYINISGKGLRFTESLPDKILDSRLIWRSGRWFLSLPVKTRTVPYGDNQALSVVAIDPGVRTFATFYSDKVCGHIGEGDFSRIVRLLLSLDNLISRISKVGKQKKQKMRIAASRHRCKIKALIEELHHKSALFLVRNFDFILLPTFETSNMVSKLKRKIRSRTVRSLLSFAHYRFKMFLKHKAFEYGKQVIDVCEAYTSKTHPETGEICNIGSANKVKLLSGEKCNRDEIGARNILLRALVDRPEGISFAVTNQ